MAAEKKEAYAARLVSYLEEYDSAFLVHADNVGSKQFQGIRAALRPGSLIAMGKNTQMKRAIRAYCEDHPDSVWSGLADQLVSNVGICFTKDPLADVKDEIMKHKVGAPARSGAIAPVDVMIPAGNTGMDPSQTTFFQVLDIPTKINKGMVEILNDVNLITTGEKVTSSQATILAKLNIRPFSYGLDIIQVFDNGSVYDPKVLSLTDDDMEEIITGGIANIAAASLELGYPTVAAVPHAIINGYKNLVAIVFETEYSFEAAAALKANL